MLKLQTHWIDQEEIYDGTQLQSHFAYRRFGIQGDSAVSFIGPVDVPLNHMVDIEDVINSEPISSDSMLNFIIESFQSGLWSGIWMQRLLMSIIQQEANLRLNQHQGIIRKGDDLFFKKRKWSVSIATVNPVSTMIHCALNIKDTGTPIPVSSFNEMNIDPVDFAKSVLKTFSEEYSDVYFAFTKVQYTG